jgi:ketosteroid isomerase-like protein
MTIKRKLIHSTIAAASTIFLLGGSPAFAEDNPRVAAEIMALARSQWASEIADQPAAQQLSAVADDYTEFNPEYPTRIDGRSMALKMAEVKPDVRSVYGDMQNPKVQVYGDTAILTYNYAGLTRDKDGKIKPQTAKSTRVYVRQGGKWMLVHANFAPVRAPD